MGYSPWDCKELDTDEATQHTCMFACNTGDLGFIPKLGRSPGGGNGNPLQYSSLENSLDSGAWWATVHGITKNKT